MTDASLPSTELLLAWLDLPEFQFAERKSKTDKGGWLRTLVAFANSTPANSVGVLYIGTNDDGSLEGMTDSEVENAMKSVLAYGAAHSWPVVPAVPIPLLHRDGKKCLAVVVPFSNSRPHFAGKAYVRRGTETVDATEAQYEELIATRNSKTREILKWLGKEVTFVTRTASGPGYSQQISTRPNIVKTCNSLFVTIEVVQGMGDSPNVQSYPLHSLEINFYDSKSRLMLIRYGDR